MAILAIDQGSSVTKAVVVGDAGGCLAHEAVPVRARLDGTGAVEYDANEILESVLYAGRAAFAAAKQPIEAVGFSNQGETVLVWDRGTGEPLTSAISWQDKRARSVTERLAEHTTRLREITGLPPDPYFAGPKMRWLRESGATGGVVTTLDSWLLYRLTGEFITDAATASRTLLLDIKTCDWSDESFELLGLADEARPWVIDCAGQIALTSAFGAEMAVTAAIVDQSAALYGFGCWERGDAKCTLGTGAFLVANSGCEAPRRVELPVSIAWRFPEEVRYCVDVSVHAAGAAISWLERIGLVRSAAEAEELVVPTSPPEVFFIPALAGGGPPDGSSHPAGAWLGLSLATGRQDLICAVIWGIAAELAYLSTRVEQELALPLARLRVDGGLATSDGLLQAVSELMRIPIERSAVLDTTAVGVAQLARRGLSEDPADEASWTPEAVFEPRLEEEQTTEWLALWRIAREAVLEQSR